MALLLSAFFYGLQEIVEGVGEELHSFPRQSGRNLLNRDTCQREIVHHLLRALNVFRKAFSQFPVITKCIDCRRRHGVHCVRANKFLDVHDVAVRWIFRARARPQYALCLRSFAGQSSAIAVR